YYSPHSHILPSFPTRRSSDSIFALIGKPMELIYSFFTLSMLRPYTGGIHFKTYKGCLAFSVVFFIVAILLAYNITLNNTIVTIRSEEHTSELQSRENLVCRLL